MELWDNLPDCILDKVYSNIIYSQPKILLSDIESYILFMDFAKSGYININDILWNFILTDINIADNKDKIIEFDSILENENSDYILKRIKKYNIKLTPDERYYIIRKFIFGE